MWVSRPKRLRTTATTSLGLRRSGGGPLINLCRASPRRHPSTSVASTWSHRSQVRILTILRLGCAKSFRTAIRRSPITCGYRGTNYIRGVHFILDVPTTEQARSVKALKNKRFDVLTFWRFNYVPTRDAWGSVHFCPWQPFSVKEAWKDARGWSSTIWCVGLGDRHLDSRAKYPRRHLDRVPEWYT